MGRLWHRTLDWLRTWSWRDWALAAMLGVILALAALHVRDVTAASAPGRPRDAPQPGAGTVTSSPAEAATSGDRPSQAPGGPGGHGSGGSSTRPPGAATTATAGGTTTLSTAGSTSSRPPTATTRRRVWSWANWPAGETGVTANEDTVYRALINRSCAEILMGGEGSGRLAGDLSNMAPKHRHLFLAAAHGCLDQADAAETEYAKAVGLTQGQIAFEAVVHYLCAVDAHVREYLGKPAAACTFTLTPPSTPSPES